MRRRRAAYYSRNGSYSRSANAEAAEDAGRFPRTRAAAYLGLSVKAFNAGCLAVGYRATEWHHVGKYANPVDYYDCEELADSPEFWRGAAEAYKSKAKRAAVLAIYDQRQAAAREERREEFRQQLIRQRDCSVRVRKHDGSVNWFRRCVMAGIYGKEIPAVGDEVGFREAAKVARQKREAEEQRKSPLMSLLKRYFTLGRDDYDREIWRLGDVTVLIHNGGINIGPRYRPDRSQKPKGHFGLHLTIEEAVEVLNNILGL